MWLKNVYPQELVNNIINIDLNSLNNIEPAGLEKPLIILLLPYVHKNSRIIEKSVN